MLRFRQFTDADIGLFRHWLTADHVKKWFQPPDDWLREVSDKAYAWIVHFIVEAGGVPIGFCQYYEYERGGETWHGGLPLSGTYSIDYLLGDPASLGRGYGTAMVRELSETVFRETDAQRMIVNPEAENVASCRTLLAAGYAYDPKNGLYILERTLR